jgi:DNA repair exonuclease SbcCD ATPase subunit
LQELSSGKFQILFILQDEKLNIEILDEGSSVTIEEVSDGELARINTATLLAIRKLMSAISSTKLNILFLDEVMGVLDDEGKEKLIEVLHKEKDLNTFLVSHEYSHPLIPKINIIKEGKVSRIDHGA